MVGTKMVGISPLGVHLTAACFAESFAPPAPKKHRGSKNVVGPEEPPHDRQMFDVRHDQVRSDPPAALLPRLLQQEVQGTVP
jgi:hypothetical protein